MRLRISLLCTAYGANEFLPLSCTWTHCRCAKTFAHSIRNSWLNGFVVWPVTAFTTSRDAPTDLTTFRSDSGTKDLLWIKLSEGWSNLDDTQSMRMPQVNKNKIFYINLSLCINILALHKILICLQQRNVCKK